MREKSADFSLYLFLLRRCLPLSSALSACCRNSGLWLSRFCRCFRLVAVPVCRCPEFCRCSGFVPPAFCRSTVCRCLWLSRVPPLSSASVAFLSVSLGVLFPFRQAVRVAENRIPGLRYEDREFICSCGLQPGADCRKPVPRLAHGDLRGADQAAFAEELHGVGACGESGAVVEDAHVEVLILVVHFAHG